MKQLTIALAVTMSLLSCATIDPPESKPPNCTWYKSKTGKLHPFYCYRLGGTSGSW